MKPGFKFFSVATALLSCSLCGVNSEISLGNVNTNGGAVTRIIGVFGVLSVMGANAFPPILQKRLGSPTPQIGGGQFSVSFEDEDSDEEEDDILDSSPRQEPHITPLNRDQCLAKLLCGMSVPVTGGGSKKNYYSEYAQIVSKFFEAFPLDDEYQSKESMELYDDYSNEDDKPSRLNSKRKPLNSSRVEATAPTLQLFDLALVDVGPKADELGKNRTRKEYDAINKRIARARRIVENIGQKLQTVRQCQSIGGCPFTFKQLREKLKKKEAQRVSSNVPLPGPLWPGNPNRKNSTPSPFQSKPKPKPQNRPIPPTPKPEPLSVEGLFSNEEPIFPYKDTNKGDDEMEEIFGPPKVNKRPSLGFHQGVDDNYHYEYNPDKPWRPGGNNGGNSYGYRPWKTKPRPQSHQQQQQQHHTYSDEGRPNNQNQQRPHSQQQHRPGPALIRPGLRPPRPAQKKTPGAPPKNRPYQPRPQPQSQQQQRPQAAAAPPVSQPKPKTPPPAPQTTAKPASTKSPFPKKKISYLNSQYQNPGGTGEDDEDSEDINKVAPVELVGNSDAGEPEIKSTTTAAPEEKEASNKKNSDDSDEYDDDDDYDDDYYDEDEDDDADAAQDEEEDDYSDEEEDDKKAEEKKKKKREELKEKRKKKKEEKKKKEAAKAKETEAEVEVKPNKKLSFDESSPYFDDETDGIDKIWTKLNFATTGANHKPPEKLKKKEETKADTKKKSSTDTVADDAEEDSDEEDEEEDDEDEGSKGGSVAPSQKTRTSSTSASGSDEDDDEVDDEHGWIRSKSQSKSKAKPKQEEKDKKSDVNDDESKTKSKSKDSKKKKKGSKNKEENSDEKDERAKWKQVMLEIGGRPLVPKPEADTANAKKTSGLVSNRFKLQFINPYGGGAPPQPLENLDGNHHGQYQPLRASQIPTSPPASGMAGLASSLPFKLNLNMNAGPLGAFTGGSNNGGGNGGNSNSGGGPPPPESHGGMGPGPGGPPGMRDSMDFSRPPNHHHHHHGPPPPHHQHPHPPNQPPHYMQHHQEPSFGSSGGAGSSLFKLNPLPALSSLFKRPSSSSSSSSSQSNFDPMQMGGGGGHNAPPMSAFVQRPIGPESSSYRRERISPASGSSSKKGGSTKSKSSKGKGTKKKTKF